MNASSSAPLQALLDIFATELVEVRFGDVDAQVLMKARDDVDRAAEALASAEALLAEARTNHQERQDAQVLLAQRALAYARVYAETNAALGERLDAIHLPRPSTRRRDAKSDPAEPTMAATTEAPPRPRGRPRKIPAATTGLFEQTGE